ncbi:MAG: 5'-deoxynucleotidase [Clostridia bacterium]|nr:5'-deoxynucleotidase [Clostridia bacterium]
MSRHFFAYLSRMKYIDRWSLMRNTRTENLSEHTLEVAVIAHALCVIANTHFGAKLNAERAAVIALFHDASEIITGDMPTPIKYFNPEINRAYKEIENVAKDKLLSMLPDELKETYRSAFYDSSEEAKRVKWADKISAYIKCVEEKKAGNREFVRASESIYEALGKIDAPEVNYFINTFLESYALTLDEQE